MTGQPKNLRRDGGGEATVAPEASRDREHLPCGTAASARWHQRRGQTPCPPCREALRTYNREYARLARQNAAWVARQRAVKERWDRNHRNELNAARRRRNQQQRAETFSAARLDEVVVARLINGEPVTYNRAERLEAVRQLRNKYLTYQQIATRLNVTDRQVHRDLADLGLTRQGAVA